MFLTIRFSTWSGTFLDELQIAWADECEKIIGAFDVARASSIVGTETCDRSTIMPRRFISDTTSCNWKEIGKFSCRFSCQRGLCCRQLPFRNEIDRQCGELVPARQPCSNLMRTKDAGRKRLSVVWHGNFSSRRISRCVVNGRKNIRPYFLCLVSQKTSIFRAFHLNWAPGEWELWKRLKLKERFKESGF